MIYKTTLPMGGMGKASGPYPCEYQGSDLFESLFQLNLNELSAQDTGNGVPLPMPPRSRRPAFTLIEMLLASTLAALLMAGVLFLTASLSRDRQRLESRTQSEPLDAAFDLLRRDLASTAAMIPSPRGDGIALIGSAGLDPAALTADGRLCRITWRIRRQGDRSMLLREQAFLDDPIRPQPWTEVVAIDATALAITPLSSDGKPVFLGDEVGERILTQTGQRGTTSSAGPVRAFQVPSRLSIRIDTSTGASVREMVVR